MKSRPFSVMLKLLFVTALALAIGYGISLYQLQRELRDYGQTQLTTLGEAVSFQTALNAGPMLLAQDWLSLNITLKQLTDDPQIQGAEVFDRQGKQLAQAGGESEHLFEQPITVQSDRLGSVRIHLSTASMERRIDAAIQRTGLVAATLAALTLFALYALARHLTAPLQALRRATRQLSEGDDIERLDENRRDEFAQINRLLNRRFAPPLPEEELPLQEQLEHLAEELRGLPPEEPVTAPLTEERFDAWNRDDDEAPAAPTPAEYALPMELDCLDRAEDLAPVAPLSSDPHSSNQYLFYVDHRSASSDSLEAEAREPLLASYRESLEQVTQLYRGTLEEDDQGNWCARFHPLSADHSHGINALCAAQLFNGLYRGVNQQRIRDFSPVVNMKMALLEGAEDEGALLVERARELSRRIEANELITDPALFADPALSERLLAEAGYRVVDDRSYLLTTLSPDYQALIDRQVEHFLRQEPVTS